MIKHFVLVLILQLIIHHSDKVLIVHSHYLNDFELPTESKREDIRILSLINPLSSEIIGISQESEDKIKTALELENSLNNFLKKDNIRELELSSEDEEILFNLIEYKNALHIYQLKLCIYYFLIQDNLPKQLHLALLTILLMPKHFQNVV